MAFASALRTECVEGPVDHQPLRPHASHASVNGAARGRAAAWRRG